LPLLAVSVYVAWRMRIRIGRLTDALNYMSQGLCMFDRSTRIVVCNQQYLQMYNLSPEIVKPGCTLRQLLEHRTDRVAHRRSGGLSPGHYCQYRGRQHVKVDRQSE